MRSQLQDRLGEQFETVNIVGQLHDVPPHAVYKLRVDGRQAVLKFDTGSTGSAGVEGRVLTLLHERTAVPVPAPLAVGDDWFLVRWEPAAPQSCGSFEPDEQWARAAGRGLATLHEESAEFIDTYGLFRVEQESAQTTELRLQTFEASGLAINGNASYREAAIQYVREREPVLDRFGHGAIAQQAVEAIEAAPELTAGVGEPVLCHGWATPEHVAVSGDAVTCLVDFEHAIAAPAEFDYWRTVFPTFGTEQHELQQAFRDGYETVRSLPEELEARRPLYALLNGVYFFESLYIQDQHDETATRKKAEQLREQVETTVEQLKTRQ